jgi:predicted ArsR family transcriptional regulator
MKDEAKGALLTAGNIATQLGVSDAKVKKALKDLTNAPTAKKGVCNYYSPDVVGKVRAAMK